MDNEKKQALRGLFSKPKGIKTKFILTYLILAAIPLLLASIYGVYYAVQILEDATLHHLTYELSSKASDIEKFLKNIHNDISFLRSSNAVSELVDYTGPKGSAGFDRLRKKVEAEAVAFSKNRPYYFQVRYINEKGYEVMRVDSDGSNPRVVPVKKLQYKGDRYYFKDAMKYPVDECYVSPMDLNVEGSEVQVPHTPVVRFAIPVFDSGGRNRGIYIINLYANFLFKQAQELNISKGGATFLVNKQGFYLSQPSKGSERSAPAVYSTESLGKDYSVDAVSGILSGKAGTVKTADFIISFNPILTGDRVSREYWVLALVYPKESIFAPIRNLEIIFVVIGISAVLAASLMGLWMARRFTEPILKLHDGVEWIARGNFDRKLDLIRTNDEVEQLSKRFNDMADALRASKKKMDEWNEELKKEVDSRTRELNMEKNKIENIIMSAKEGIIVTDNEGRVIILNPAAESILGVVKNEMLWKKVSQCREIPEKIRKFLEEDPSVLRNPVITNAESKILEITLVPLSYEGEKFGSRLVIRDITERHKLIEERMTIEKQLFHADKLVSLGELSAGIAHEIGNPLAAIKTVIQAMNEEKPFTGAQKKYMKRILNEVDRLASFLKTFSVYANPLVNQTAKSRVDFVLREVLLLIKNEALKHDVVINYSISKYMPHIALDSDQLKQVFINIFINAIQAMPEGGAITVTASSVDSKESAVAIAISDTGPGIPGEIIANIFDPFFTTKPTGTGLGLSIVHRIINEHNGEIKVSSTPGKGTTFEVILPAAVKEEIAITQRG